MTLLEIRTDEQNEEEKKNDKKQILLTGDRPTGSLHIGHYFGSLISRKQLEQEYQSFIMIADIQALTDNWDNPEKVRQNVFEVALDNLALGLDTNKTSIFIQSQIPQIAELTVLYSNLVTVSRLQRNPTVKTEINQKLDKFGEKMGGVTFGFLGYPVSQAADITCFDASVVPVGVDQLPMIEQTREIAQKFNRIYGQTLVLPEAKLSLTPKILGLDGNSKMSKSLNNCIFLKDSEEETTLKIKHAKTDSFTNLSYDPETRPEISNLISIFALCNDITPELAVKDLQAVNYGAFKEKLGQSINSYFAQFRQRRLELASKPDMVKQILEQGRDKAEQIAKQTMQRVREAIKINY